jgi:hypothetical protein
VVVRARVVLAEVGVYKGVVQGLVVDPQEEELAGLQMGLELKGNDSKGIVSEESGFDLVAIVQGRECILLQSSFIGFL